MCLYELFRLEKCIHPKGGRKTTCIRSHEGDVFALISDATDINSMNASIQTQLSLYTMVLSSLKNPNKDLTITYETKEDDFRETVQLLNSNSVFTKPYSSGINFGSNFLDSMK